MCKIPYFNYQLNFQSSHLTKNETEDASKRISSYCMGALNCLLDQNKNWKLKNGPRLSTLPYSRDVKKACKVEPCTLLPLVGSMLIKFTSSQRSSQILPQIHFLAEEASCKIMRKQCARFHFACLFIIIFHATFFRFIYTRVSVTY